MSNADTYRCERCGETLKENRIVWLELSNTDNRYYLEIPYGHKSQGGFPFGRDCAQSELTGPQSSADRSE